MFYFANVKVRVLEITSYHQPYWVKCELTDSKGKKHFFEDKLPMFCSHDQLPPCPGIMRCYILEEKENTVLIDTSYDDIPSTTGEYQFEVAKEVVINKE